MTMKRYNTPHRSRVIKTRLTEEEYAEFSERVSLCQMRQSEFIRQALTKSRRRPVITVSPVNDTLLATVGKLIAEYGTAEQYLTFEHDEFTVKPIFDENGRPVPRTDYLISALNCGGEDFAIACMRSNFKYGKNQKREAKKSHHYIINFDPRDGTDNGLTIDQTQKLDASTVVRIQLWNILKRKS